MQQADYRRILPVCLGNGLEIYDFTVYAFFAIQIGHTFFPSHDPQVSLLASFATFGAGFLTRPLGALVIGRLGDSHGRGPAMILSMALMGLAVAALVVCPGYDRIGLAAPVIALAARLLQGFALGGEVGPATSYMLECAPLHRRGRYVAAQRATQLVANLAGSTVGFLLARAMSEQAFADHGWRIAIGLGAVVAPYALYLRRNLGEPVLPPGSDRAEAHLAQTAAQSGVWLPAACLAVVCGAGSISAYMMIYMVTLGQNMLLFSPAMALGAQMLGSSAGLVTVFAGTILSDRLGRRPVLLAGNVAAMVLVPLVFGALLRWPGPLGFCLAMAATGALLNFPMGVGFAMASEIFPRHQRSLATSLTYTLPVTLFGGSTQFILAWLVGLTGSAMVPAWYVAGALAISTLGVLLVRETAPARLGLVPVPAR